MKVKNCRLWRAAWDTEGDRLWRLSAQARKHVRSSMAIRDCGVAFATAARQIGNVLAPALRAFVKALP